MRKQLDKVKHSFESPKVFDKLLLPEDSELRNAIPIMNPLGEDYSNYQRYQLMQVDKTRVILACRIIINDLLGKLYRYDYRFGYNLLLDEENSIEKKLHTPVREEWEDEDYETCNC